MEGRGDNTKMRSRYPFVLFAIVILSLFANSLLAFPWRHRTFIEPPPSLSPRCASSACPTLSSCPTAIPQPQDSTLQSGARLPTLTYSSALSSIIERPGLPTLIPDRITLNGASSTYPENAYSGRKRIVVVGAQEWWGAYVSVEYFNIFRIMRHVYAWEFLEGRDEGGDSWTTLADTLLLDGRPPPAILFFMEAWHIANWGPIDTRLAETSLWMFADDLHWKSEDEHRRKSSVLADLVHVIAGAYMHLIPSMFPEASSKPRVHIPHAITTLFMLPLNVDPAPRVLLAGAVPRMYYPYRAHVWDKIQGGDTRFEVLPHPGYGTNLTAIKSAPNVGANFANSLNKYLAVITDGLIYNYSVAKMFEVPACGALLLVNSEVIPVLTDIGMHVGTHYLAYTLQSLDDVVDWVLSPLNRKEVDTIRAEGQALVWARHTVYHRAASLDTAARLYAQPPNRSVH